MKKSRSSVPRRTTPVTISAPPPARATAAPSGKLATMRRTRRCRSVSTARLVDEAAVAQPGAPGIAHVRRQPHLVPNFQEPVEVDVEAHIVVEAWAVSRDVVGNLADQLWGTSLIGVAGMLDY